MGSITRAVRAFVSDDSAATMVEYGIMVALIAGVCFGIITTLGGQVQAAFASASAGL